MICLLLIMTMIFINGTESAEQKVRHSDTLLKEEDANARTKAWLLMVESGKVDQEELRRITPKSIFIAPLLSSRAGKCKEGFRHDHLGQCVKVIKIDPQVQLDLLLQKLNKLYGDKKEEKEEEKEELFEVSSGPLHFSLPISNVDEKAGQTTTTTTSEAKPEVQQVSSTTANGTASEDQSATEFIPIPAMHRNQTNQTNQTKEMESSGAEPFNETHEVSRSEGSGDGQSGSGDGFPGEEEEEPTTPPRVSLLEESDYFDATEPESTTSTETQSTTEAPEEALVTTNATLHQPLPKGSYQNITDASGVNNANDGSAVLPKENAREEIAVKNDPYPERILFPDEDEDDGDGSRTPPKPPGYGSRIRFPDEPPPERQPPSHLSPPHPGSESARHQVHSSAIPREQFWWLPKNWQIDENHHKSALVKVWSRLPLIHDVPYSRETADDFEKPLPPEEPPPARGDETPSAPAEPAQQHHTSRIVKPFKSSRFHDILITPRQNFRFQR